MEKDQVTYKGRPNIITSRLLTRYYESQKILDREHKCQPRLLYPAKLSIIIGGETKVFHEKTIFTNYLSTNPALQRIIKGKHKHKDENYNLEKAKE